MLDQILQPEINSKHTCEVHFQSTTDNVLMTFLLYSLPVCHTSSDISTYPK